MVSVWSISYEGRTRSGTSYRIIDRDPFRMRVRLIINETESDWIDDKDLYEERGDI